MDTSDGIAHEDWERVRELSIDIVNASANESGGDAAYLRLFDFLDELEAKYGRKASIIATRADFQGDPEVALTLLQEAYEISLATDDFPNQWLIAESMAGLAIEEFGDKQQALRWLEAMERLREVYSFSVRTIAELEKLKTRLKEL